MDTTSATNGIVIATGARTRTIGDPLAGVFTLRTLGDSLAIRAAFDAAPQRVVVVGAGFIGAEVAATARGRGIDVTMIEMAEAPFERSLGAAMGAVLADVHRAAVYHRIVRNDPNHITIETCQARDQPFAKARLNLKG